MRTVKIAAAIIACAIQAYGAATVTASRDYVDRKTTLHPSSNGVEQVGYFLGTQTNKVLASKEYVDNSISASSPGDYLNVSNNAYMASSDTLKRLFSVAAYPAWEKSRQSSGNYTAGDIVSYSGMVYRCISTPSGTDAPDKYSSKWEVKTIGDLIAENTPGDYSNVSNNAYGALQKVDTTNTVNSIITNSSSGVLSMAFAYPLARFDYFDLQYPPNGSIVEKDGRLYRAKNDGYGDGSPWFPVDDTYYFEDVTEEMGTNALVRLSTLNMKKNDRITDEVNTIFADRKVYFQPMATNYYNRLTGPLSLTTINETNGVVTAADWGDGVQDGIGIFWMGGTWFLRQGPNTTSMTNGTPNDETVELGNYRFVRQIVPNGPPVYVGELAMTNDFIVVPPSTNAAHGSVADAKATGDALYTGFTEWVLYPPYVRLEFKDGSWIPYSEEVQEGVAKGDSDSVSLSWTAGAGANIDITATRRLVTPTKTSQLVNNGSNGVPFATVNDIPKAIDVVAPSTNAIDGAAADAIKTGTALYTGFTIWSLSGLPTGYDGYIEGYDSSLGWTMVCWPVDDEASPLWFHAQGDEDSLNLEFSNVEGASVTASRNLVTPKKTSQLINNGEDGTNKFATVDMISGVLVTNQYGVVKIGGNGLKIDSDTYDSVILEVGPGFAADNTNTIRVLGGYNGGRIEINGNQNVKDAVVISGGRSTVGGPPFYGPEILINGTNIFDTAQSNAINAVVTMISNKRNIDDLSYQTQDYWDVTGGISIRLDRKEIPSGLPYWENGSWGLINDGIKWQFGTSTAWGEIDNSVSPTNSTILTFQISGVTYNLSRSPVNSRIALTNDIPNVVTSILSETLDSYATKEYADSAPSSIVTKAYIQEKLEVYLYIGQDGGVYVRMPGN